MKNPPSKILPLLATIICHTIWGFSFMFSRQALNHVPVFTLLSHRFILAFFFMNLLLLTGRFPLKLSLRRLGPLLLLGLMQPVVYFIGEQYGILHSSTIFSGVMIAMIPIVATLAAGPFLKEKPSGGQLLFSLISVGGVIGIGLMTGSSGSLDYIGIIGLLVAVGSASGYLLLSRSVSQSFSPFERTYAMMGLAALVFTVLALIQNGGGFIDYLTPLGNPAYLGPVLYLALLASVVSFFLSGYALTYLSVARESVFSNLTTAVSVFAGAVFLKEGFSWLSLLFTMLILIGIWGVQKSAHNPEGERINNTKEDKS